MCPWIEKLIIEEMCGRKEILEISVLSKFYDCHKAPLKKIKIKKMTVEVLTVWGKERKAEKTDGYMLV